MCDPTFWLMAFNGIMALATVCLAYAAFRQIKESSRASSDQVAESRRSSSTELGVHLWLEFQKQFDDIEMKRSRMRLIKQLYPYRPGGHDEITEEVLEWWETLATVYNRGMLDEDLVQQSFSYHANRWWAAAEPYIMAERQRHNDDPSYYDQFEKFAKAMKKYDDEKISAEEVKRFYEDEGRLMSQRRYLEVL